MAARVRRSSSAISNVPANQAVKTSSDSDGEEASLERIPFSFLIEGSNCSAVCYVGKTVSERRWTVASDKDGRLDKQRCLGGYRDGTKSCMSPYPSFIKRRRCCKNEITHSPNDLNWN
ncbi:hypothetical protein L1987_08993 [Smallanthus sonchifolius]|uniref:Uncharacterized protein n=1 Tax=Smallanthus sonchifolius TaxID=185202 RepID=A0ACB9JNT9_9ASTR|nr:hypothetical protein L1987_08993 [Smallanthus sonchifolius]